MPDTLQGLESSLDSLVIDTVTNRLVVLVDVIPNCHWGCEVRRTDGTLAYRTRDEILPLPTASLRPLAVSPVFS